MPDRSPVDKHEILKRLAELEVSSWSYLWEEGEVRHIGPMAQEFREAFEVGDDERRIDIADGFGIVVAAIQALHEIVTRQAGELAELRARVERLG